MNTENSAKVCFISQPKWSKGVPLLMESVPNKSRGDISLHYHHHEKVEEHFSEEKGVEPPLCTNGTGPQCQGLSSSWVYPNVVMYPVKLGLQRLALALLIVLMCDWPLYDVRFKSYQHFEDLHFFISMSTPQLECLHTYPRKLGLESERVPSGRIGGHSTVRSADRQSAGPETTIALPLSCNSCLTANL